MDKSSWSLADHPKMSPPKNNDGYLEVMAKVIFSAGLNWNVVEKKWPGIKGLFYNFSLNKVAEIDSREIDKLLKNPAMIRSFVKIRAIVKNAQALLDVKKEFGSISSYLEKTKKLGEEASVKDLGKRFSFLGPSTSLMFLYGVGQDMPEMMKKAHRK